MRRVGALVLTVGLLGACTDSGPVEVTDPSPSSSTTTTASGGTASTAPPAAGTLGSISLSTITVGELVEPIAMAPRPGSPDLYVAEKGGRLRLIKVTTNETTQRVSYQVQSTPLLDLSDEVINEGERGLLGVTFSSDGRKLYVNYTRQPDGWTVVSEYELGDRSTVDARSRRDLLLVEQPFPNHNGGHLAIGPDGYLYVGLGDGGSGGDPNGNAQRPTTLLGKILRIDPSGGTDGGPAYGIPPGNPFADGSGGAAEVYLYGVRNPWRFSFDEGTGDLWVGDVGQGEWEEIDHLPAAAGFDPGKGANLGWNEMEGTHPYEGGSNPAGAVLPIFDYGHDAGCAVIGGYVYRGTQIPQLGGVYLYADSCASGLSGLQVDGGTVIDSRTWDLPIEGIYSLGLDDKGEVYALLASGPVVKITAG